MTVDAPSDEELLQAWRAGDASAGGTLYDRHVAAVARFFRNKTPDHVEELIQQTFLGLVEARDRLRENASVRAFLLGIARHKLYDHLRGSGRDVGFETTTAAELAPGPSTILARKREQRLLLEGLRRIPVEHQVVLELCYWEGLNAAEIADIFSISHSAMRSRLSRARALLKQALAELAASKAELDSTVRGLDKWAAEIRAKI